LHIRRGDTVKLGCNTAPDHVDLLLNCHLGHFNGTFPTIVLFTDERDKGYIEAVGAVLRKYAVRGIHGDSELLSLLVEKQTLRGESDPTSVDNYFLFVASSAVKARASVQLEFGGHKDSTGRQPKSMAEHCERQVRCKRNNLFLPAAGLTPQMPAEVLDGG
jgi:hypothetical protein